MNSEAVWKVADYTVGLIEEKTWQQYKLYTEKFADSPMSFENVGKILKIGDEAGAIVSGLQEKILNQMNAHKQNNLDFTSQGNINASIELIEEYDEICKGYTSKIKMLMEEDISSIKSMAEENMLMESMAGLAQVQYECLLKVSDSQNQLFTMFLEWFKNKIQEIEQAALEQVEKGEAQAEALKELSAQTVEQIMTDVLESNDGNTSSGVGASGGTGSKADTEDKQNQEEQLKKEVETAKSEQIDAFIKELDTPEKIKDFKENVQECNRQMEECRRETDAKKKQTKFQRFCNFLKKGAKKYGKPIGKALSILVPLVAPQGSIAGKIFTKLPEVMACFDGKVDAKKDMDKVSLGVDCLKTMGLDQLPEKGEQIKEHLEKNAKAIADDVIKLVLGNDNHRKVLGLDDVELSKPENQALYKKMTGKDIKPVPQKKQSYQHNFNQFNAEKLNNLTPEVAEKELNEITGQIRDNMPKLLSDEMIQKLQTEIEELKKKLDDSSSYVTLQEQPAVTRVINQIRDIAGDKGTSQILNQIDGRYNKEDMSMLLGELGSAIKNGRPETYSKNLTHACENFVRRQSGYPKKEEERLVVNDVKELIPVLDGKVKSFTVEDKRLRDVITGAMNLNYQRDGKITRKHIVRGLGKANGIMGAIGIGALIAFAGAWPLGMLYSAGATTSLVSDEYRAAYSKLVTQIGDRRVDELVSLYEENGNYCYERKGDF